jgi:ABC-type multidrug transport system fused ATPase/permease subunit
MEMSNLRSHVALVGQEPVLFDVSIRKLFMGLLDVIAHRLSTIQNADCILVAGGKVIESGTPHELVDRKGEHYAFVQQQNLHT